MPSRLMIRGFFLECLRVRYNDQKACLSHVNETNRYCDQVGLSLERASAYSVNRLLFLFFFY
jgi:hypothetical protein